MSDWGVDSLGKEGKASIIPVCSDDVDGIFSLCLFVNI